MPRIIPIRAIKDEKIIEFSTIKEASVELDLFYTDILYALKTGKLYEGYKFEYISLIRSESQIKRKLSSPETKLIKRKTPVSKKPKYLTDIIAMGSRNELINIFSSISEGIVATGASRSCIIKSLETGKKDLKNNITWIRQEKKEKEE